MTGFWIAAAVLLLAAVAALIYPVMRAKGDSPRFLVFAITALGVPALALSIYFSIGSWRSPESAPHAQQQELGVIVGQLADRLRGQGGSLDEWMMLGKSYTMMERFGDAASAYAQARALAGEDNLDVLAFYAEATVLADQDQLTGEAGQIFEKILEERPNDMRGLWYGGLAAYEQSQFRLAVSRWQQLLGQAPPETLRPIIEQRISDAQLRVAEQGESAVVAQAPAQMAAAAGSAPAERPASVPAQPAPTGGPAVIRVSVSAEPGLISSVPPGTPVFVLARSTSPGPPLAARRMSVRDLPFTLELSDSDAMVAGNDLSSAERVEVVARIALGGTPVAQPGDLFGEQILDVSSSMSPVRISINKRVE